MGKYPPTPGQRFFESVIKREQRDMAEKKAVYDTPSITININIGEIIIKKFESDQDEE